MAIEEAIEYVENEVIRPALDDERVPKKLKRSIQRARSWINSFREIGDLWDYLCRFDGNQNPEVANQLRELGHTTFEALVDPFQDRFAGHLHERFRLDDLVVGELYSSWFVLTISKTYNPQAVGIQSVGNFGRHSAVVIKCTLSGGKYPNQWLNMGRRLKYYLYNNDPSSSFNRSISEYPELPVLVFVRQVNGKPFEYQGQFKNVGVRTDSDGEHWFELSRLPTDRQGRGELDENVRKDFESRVHDIADESEEERDRKALAAKGKPAKTPTTAISFKRDPYVVDLVLRMSKGICGGCGQPAPFKRKRDGSPYLEVHHKHHLANDGVDEVENAVALCPNCHAREHYGDEPRWLAGNQ